MFLLTETWHTTSEDVALRRCVPPGYICLDIPRPSTSEVRTNDGDVVAIVTNRVSCKVSKPSIQPTIFDSLCFTMAGAGSSTAVVLLICRPGSAAMIAVIDVFFTELTKYL